MIQARSSFFEIGGSGGPRSVHSALALGGLARLLSGRAPAPPAHPIVGITNSAPSRTPEGQRVVIVLRRV